MEKEEIKMSQSFPTSCDCFLDSELITIFQSFDKVNSDSFCMIFFDASLEGWALRAAYSAVFSVITYLALFLTYVKYLTLIIIICY